MVTRTSYAEQIGGGTATGRCWILFLQVLAHIKPSAFTSSNYISEHLDCLFHSIHFHMKALSLFSFTFTWYKDDFWRCPSLLPLRNLKYFKHFKLLRRNNSVVSGCVLGTKNSPCQTCSHKFCHRNAAFISRDTLYVRLTSQATTGLAVREWQNAI